MTWLLLTMAYMGVALLLLSLNVASHWSLRIRLFAVVLVSGLYVGTWLGIGALRGSPTDAALPAAFRLNWVQVEEPDKSAGTPGAIYFWIRELDAEGHPAVEPRSHVVPFAAEAAREARRAQEELMKGVQLNGYLTRGLLAPAENTLDGGATTSGQRAGAEDAAEPQFEFRPVDKPVLPAKGMPGAVLAPAQGG